MVHGRSRPESKIFSNSEVEARVARRMRTLVEDFLQHLRHERGQADHTQRTYSALLNKFVEWAGKQGLSDWKSVELRHLMSFLQHERERTLANLPKESPRR